jgi:hypothetical protein
MANPFADAEFRWNQYNRAKVASHNVSEWEAEHVVRNAKPPYPRHHKKGSFLAVGKLSNGMKVQVVFLQDPVPWKQVYVVHAMMV